MALWRGSLLTLLDKCPTGVIVKCDLKMIEIKSLEVMRKAASGVGKSFYKSVPHFLSKLPMANFTLIPEKVNYEEFAKERLSFIKKFFEAMIAGF